MNKDNYGEDKIGQALIKKAESAFTSPERTNVESLWAELAQYIVTSQNGKFRGSQSKGVAKDQRLFDGTAVNANRDLASSMHSTITNPASKWSKFRFRETALNNIPEGNAWTEHATTEVHNALSDSNFDNQMGSVYLSLCGFGTAAMLHDELPNGGGTNFVAWHLSEIAYMENSLGKVDCIYRKFKRTLKQAYEEFGDAIGDMKNQVDARPMEELEFYHCVYMRDKDKVKYNSLGLAAPQDRPVASVYIMAKGSKIVREDGYYEFPVYVPRWLQLPGEVYGFGPGHVARADTLTLNAVARQLLKGLAKAVDPVIFQEANNILTGDMRPGKLVSVRNLQGIKEGVTQSRFDIGFLEKKNLQDAIKAAFYIDKLLLPPRTETGEMTAYEIQQRLEQMQVILGPPLSRFNTELLQPCIMRQLKILMRNGVIAPIPEEVIAASKAPIKNGTKDIDLNIAYVNSLARSQQMSEIRNITSWVQETASLAQVNPPVLDNINFDAVVEKSARIRDIPEELVRTEEEVAQIRDDRAQQQNAASALQAGESMSNMAKNVAPLVQGGGNK